MSTVIFTYGALAFAVICFLGALIYLLRGLGARSQKNSQSYNFGRQETKNSMLRGFLMSLIMLLLGVICIGIYLLRPFGGDEPEAIIDNVPTTAPVVQPTQQLVPEQPTLPSTLPLPVLLPTQTPPPTKTPSPESEEPVGEEPAPAEEAPPALQQVRVAIEVGVNLRSGPTVLQDNVIEWVRVNDLMEVFPGTENADGYDWQEVRTEAGNIGWVAVNFIEPVE